MGKAKSKTRNESGLVDAVGGTKTFEHTIANNDGSKTSARGNSPGQARQRANKKNKK